MYGEQESFCHLHTLYVDHIFLYMDYALNECVPTVLTKPLYLLRGFLVYLEMNLYQLFWFSHWRCGFIYLNVWIYVLTPWIYVPACMDKSTDYSLGFIASTHTENGVYTPLFWSYQYWFLSNNLIYLGHIQASRQQVWEVWQDRQSRTLQKKFLKNFENQIHC